MEVLERVGQLQAAAADPGVVLAAYLEGLVFRNRFAGLGELALAGEDLAGHDERLGLGTALHQAALDQCPVGTALAGPGLAHVPITAAEGRRSAAGPHGGGRRR